MRNIKILANSGFTVDEVRRGTEAFAKLGYTVESEVVEVNDLKFTSDEGNLAFM